MVASSLKETSEIWTHATSLIPTKVTLQHYVEGWAGFGAITFATFYKNSFIFAGVGTIATVASSAVVAYAFAKIRFVGRDLWFSIMLLTLVLPAQVLMIPQYIVFTELGWVNTFFRDTWSRASARPASRASARSRGWFPAKRLRQTTFQGLASFVLYKPQSLTNPARSVSDPLVLFWTNFRKPY